MKVFKTATTILVTDQQGNCVNKDGVITPKVGTEISVKELDKRELSFKQYVIYDCYRARKISRG